MLNLTGDFEDAIDTLNLAIGLIKQSVTGHTDTSHIIIQTLSDCLRGVEEQAAAMTRCVCVFVCMCLCMCVPMCVCKLISSVIKSL